MGTVMVHLQRIKSAAEEKPSKKSKPEAQGLTMLTRSARRGADASKTIPDAAQNSKNIKLESPPNTETSETLAAKVLASSGLSIKNPRKLKLSVTAEEKEDDGSSKDLNCKVQDRRQRATPTGDGKADLAAMETSVEDEGAVAMDTSQVTKRGKN